MSSSANGNACFIPLPKLRFVTFDLICFLTAFHLHNMAAERGTLCGVCTSLSVSRSADKWCPECDEGFCSTCLSHHSVAKATRDHEVINVENYEKLPDFILKIRQTCETHGAKYQNYCRLHECPCCRKCIDTTHKKCQDLPPLEEVMYTAKSSFAMENLVERIGVLKKFYSCAQKEIENTTKDRKKECKDIEVDIKRIRQEINRHLDTMEQQILQKLSEINSTNQQCSNKWLKEMMTKENKSAELAENLETIKQYGSDMQVFLGAKQIDIEVIEEERNVLKMSEERNFRLTSVSLPVDKTLQNIIKNVEKLGTICLEEKRKCVVFQNLIKQQAQTVSLRNRDELGIFQTFPQEQRYAKNPSMQQPADFLTNIQVDRRFIIDTGNGIFALYNGQMYKKCINGWIRTSGTYTKDTPSQQY